MNRTVRELLLFALATVAAIVVTWPLAGELFAFTRLADRTLDDHVYWWDFWWLREALVVRHADPLFCPDVFWPHGASLVVSPFALPYGLLSLPLQSLFGSLHGSVIAVKVIALLTFPVALHGISLLLRSFGVSFWASVLAGTLFAFAPFRMVQLGRIHYLAGALVPWFLWAGHVAVATRRWRWCAGAGLLFACAGATDAALLLEMVVAAAALWSFEVVRGESWRSALSRWIACGLVGALCLSPLLIPFLKQFGAADGTDVASRLEFSEEPSTVQRLLSPDGVGLCWYLSPALVEAVAMDVAERDQWIGAKSSARLTADIYESFRPPLAATGAIAVDVAVAALVVVVAAVALVVGLRERGTWILALLAMVGFVVALGPTRSFGGSVVHMPYSWLARVVPGMAAGRYPPAHLRLFLLGVALVAGFGAARSPRWLVGAAAAVALAFVAASPLRPLHFEPVPMDDAYETIARDPEPGAVLELPIKVELGLRRMALGQIRHGRPLMTGPLTRVPKSAWSFFDDEPLVPRLLHPPPPRPPGDPALAMEVSEDLAILRRYGVRWLLLRKSLVQSDPQAFTWLREYLARHGLVPTETSEGHWLVRVDRS